MQAVGRAARSVLTPLDPLAVSDPVLAVHGGAVLAALAAVDLLPDAVGGADAVVARAAAVAVLAAAADEQVPPRPTIQQVVATVAVELVVAALDLGRRHGLGLLRPAGVAEQGVVAAEAEELVVPAETADLLVAGGPADRVGAGGADEVGRIDREGARRGRRVGGALDVGGAHLEGVRSVGERSERPRRRARRERAAIDLALD